MSAVAAPTPRTAERAPSAEQDTRAVWRGVFRSGGVRMLVLPVSAVLGILVTRLVIDNYGLAAFAQYGLLVGIGTLLPFADLGMAAAVVNAVAASPDVRADDHLRRVVVTAVRILLCSAAVLTAVAVGITAAGLWPVLLGSGLLPGSGPLVAMACVVLIAVGLPVGIGQRVLAGLGRNHVAIAVLGLQTPLVLGTLVLFLATGVPGGSLIAAVPFAVTLALSVVCTVIAARQLRPTLGRALRDVFRLRSVRGARVFDVAWPMLVQMIALPLAMQTDRLVLSHLVGPGELGEYNLASQMFTPIWAVVNAAGFTLWPVFARARARGAESSPLPMAAAFGALAAVMTLVVAVASPWLADLASGGVITLGPALVIAFGVLMVLQAVKYPMGMFLTDAPGLRYQAYMIVAMLPVNLGLSWVFASWWGAVGPVVGSVVGVLLFQVLGTLVYVRRRLAAAQAEPAPYVAGAR
ncbi:oligosaccharide flippase family protein [Modestobacter sp. KNN46-3]|uniref:oligosaccharide flippase family protein n=1 Tax=Modestobacter sp. KNN46-3 TaxID=2711218 RepID=UPI0013DF1E69|nr:oligosaccharide flippase family protein [Modestobacter sp. KNN46-3]